MNSGKRCPLAPVNGHNSDAAEAQCPYCSPSAGKPSLTSVSAPPPKPKTAVEDSGLPHDVMERINRFDEWEFDLAFVERDESLEPTDIANMLAGRQTMLEEQAHEVMSERRAEAARQMAQQVFRDCDLDEFAESDLFSDVIAEIQDRDNSDPLPQLLRNTRDQLMRTSLTDSLANDPSLTYMPSDTDGAAEVMKRRVDRLVDIVAERSDRETAEANRDALESTVLNGPETWHEAVRFEFIWNGNPGDFAPSDGEKRLGFSDPHILLIDPYNGSGFDGQLRGNFSTTIDETDGRDEGFDKDERVGRVFLDDHNELGWGWDATAGVVHSAYRTDVDVSE